MAIWVKVRRTGKWCWKMTVNEPAALPLGSLTVVRKPSKGGNRRPPKNRHRKSWRLSGCYRSPLWFIAPAFWECACVYLCIPGLGCSHFYNIHLAVGLWNPPAKVLLRGKDILRWMLNTEQLHQPVARFSWVLQHYQTALLLPTLDIGPGSGPSTDPRRPDPLHLAGTCG